MKFLKIIALSLLTILAVVGLWSISDYWYKWTNPKTEVSSTVLLQRIEKVVKLTTVEGNFSEIYNYKNHIMADVWPFRKKALVRVNAKVAVGYNFENLSIDVNHDEHSITIEKFPEPEILSIEHDMDYYNFENGLFNMITNKDITEMGIEAKQFIAEKATESDLFDRAEEQKTELFDMLTMAMEASGWKLVYNTSKLKN